MMGEAEEEKSGEIDSFEVCNLMAKRIKATENDEELVEVFNHFDKNQDGIIDYKDLMDVFFELGQHDITEDDCKLLIKLHD